MRLVATCDFNGHAYAGWQTQPNVITIQSTIEGALSKLAGTSIPILGCGRTDAGVHGRNYVFHFDWRSERLTDNLLFKLNCMLPADISIRSIQPVSDDFHARFSALSREYIYRIHTCKDPFLIPVSWYNYRLRAELLPVLQDCMEGIKNLESFGTFCKSGSGNKTNICHITDAKWSAEGYQIQLHIRSDRFLRGMVRLIVGACVNVALGKTSSDDLKRLAIQQVRLPGAYTAPANGLTFEGVTYPQITVADTNI